MCEVSDKLKFCTCLNSKDVELINIHDSLEKFQRKKLPKSKEPFCWVLYEYMGTLKGGAYMIGVLDMPQKAINSLTESFVLEQINNENCFDFHYEPKEGDNLQIYFQVSKFQTEFLSFIYRSEAWEIDHYNTFGEKIEPKNFGLLKVRE
ncbi:hypothetical protein ACLI1A_13855 [Flavobacterium sp. RHBU_3]|uniref:hypothetical protein n=1 Tax=Flavobacterium sp. RHBU_3 TaxID=3391184 RepID=UPI0039854307